MNGLEKRLCLVGLGLLVLSALLRTVGGWLSARLGEALADGLSAEQTATSHTLTAIGFIVDVVTPAGAAVLAVGIVLSALRRRGVSW